MRLGTAARGGGASSSHSTARAAAAALVIAVLSAGCTGDGDEDPGASTSDVASAGGSDGGAEVSQGTGDGPSPEDLSRAVLDAAEPTDVIGSVTAPVERLRGADVTLDVLDITSTTSGTRVTVRLSTQATAVSISTLTFGGGRTTSQYFLHDILLEDTDVTAMRYRPLRFQDYRRACVCPFLPLDIGTQPRTVSVLFPRLPSDVQRVNLRMGDSALVVTDVPMGDGR